MTLPNKVNKLLIACIVFTAGLYIARVLYSKQLTYGFYCWNIFLAVIPYICSSLLHPKNSSLKNAMLIIAWLLFFPNAPYLITDIFHFCERPPVPLWYDLLLVTQAAFTGIMIGFFSLKQVEIFLYSQYKKNIANRLVLLSIFLCSYGMYIGRFARFNSWDVVTQPWALYTDTIDRVLNPVTHIKTWAFTTLFAFMLSLIYYTLKDFGHYNYAKQMPKKH